MLQRLQIRNFVLIDELTMEFFPGFSVITGETGAGKSILLGAIGLLMGARADSTSVRPGADRCVIEAYFSQPDEGVLRILEAEDIEFDPEECIIRREISTKGKSRAFVNDSPASLALLKRLSEYLIDIHSQHKNLLLGDAEFQRSVLDLYSQNAQTLAQYSEIWQRYRSLERELKTLEAELEERLKEQDYLQFQFDQLEEAQLRDGELEELEDEEQRLVHALDIKSGFARAYQALDDDERGVLSALSSVLEAVGSVRRYYDTASDLYERLSSVRIELRDLQSTIEDHAERIEYDPERLEIVQQRLDLLNGLLRKHGKQTLGDLIEEHQLIGEQLEQIAGSDERIGELRLALEASKSELNALAEALHSQRTESAERIQKALIPMLHELGMPHVRFLIDIKRLDAPTPTGQDQVTYLFSANKEIEPEPVADIASGGEISRLMLSLKALIADKRSLPTIIFDEIDTGVSGDIADRIGVILQQMGRGMQVLAVTHLPQIAASGGKHYYIYKEHGKETTRSHIRLLDRGGRIEEIARMQSGNNLNAITLAAATELLDKAQAKITHGTKK